jgi:UDP:flavonoid glycosyltransferase YjiC (YdhE family)
MPLAATTQWDLVAAAAQLMRPVLEALIRLAAELNIAGNVRFIDRFVDDVFAVGGTLGTLVNYPRQLGSHAARLPHAELLGSCVRSEAPDRFFERLARARRARPRAYVSLGSFLSAHSDVLRGIADALRMLGWDAVIATGATDLNELSSVPSTWVLGEHLPQVAALEACDVVVCHGGNNSVTEALTAGLPILATPFE